MLVVVFLGAMPTLTVSAAAHAAAPTSPKTLSASDCGLDRAAPTYNGTNVQRKLYRAIPDPLKVATYPCAFKPDVRGMRLETTALLLVSGGRLVRRIPLAASGPVQLKDLVAVVNDPTWISMPTPGTVQISAALIQMPGTILVVSAPAVRTVHLVQAPSVFLGGFHATATFTGVDVTSWLPDKQTVVPDGVRYRPHVLYSNSSTLNVHASRFAYLGSDVTSSYGVSWRVGGTTGVVDHSIFEHNFFGAYTFGAKDIQFTNDIFRYNMYYGLDPHDYTTGLVVRSNEAYGNGSHGIIFSRYVTDGLVENNNSHDNRGNGIMMDYHSDRNTIRNNRVERNAQGIVFSGSALGRVTGNTISKSSIGIRISRDGAHDVVIAGNAITDVGIGIQLYDGAAAMTVQSNTIDTARRVGMFLDAPRSNLDGNVIRNTPLGLDISTVTAVRGGSITATETGAMVRGEGIASLNGVAITADRFAVRAEPTAIATLTSAAYTVDRFTTGRQASTLDLFGVAVLLLAVLCQVEHVRRGRRRVAVHGPASVAWHFQAPKTRELKPPRPGSRLGFSRALKAQPEVRPVGADNTAAKSPGPEKRTRFRPDIEGLRAIAVLLVVLSHSHLGLPGGYVGVDVFFVISGFLITGQLVRDASIHGRISLPRFYARRARRILPAAVVVSLATLAGVRAWSSPLRVTQYAHDAAFAALSVVNWRLAQQGTDYFHSTDPPSPFQHYWSLSVEEQFYMVWPLLVVLTAVLLGRKIGLKRALSGCLVVIIGVSLTLSVLVTSGSPSFAYFGSHTRAWELALGALIAVSGPMIKRGRATVMTWCGLAAVLAAGFLFGQGTTYPGIAVALPVLGAGIVIAGGSSSGTRGASRFLSLPPMRFVGQVSYSWYLWHWPILVLLPDALGREATARERVLAVLVSLGLAVVTYYLVEQPFRTKSVFLKSDLRGLILGGGLAATAVAAAMVAAAAIQIPGAGSDGLPELPIAAGSGPSTAPATATRLAESIRVASVATSLPSRLTPTLANAPHSFPDSNGCEAKPTATVPKLPCEFGDTTAVQTMVLFGDSHAGMWLSAMDSIAKSHHYKLVVMTKGACPFGSYVDYQQKQVKGRTTAACNAWRAAVLAHIARLRPSIVVLAEIGRRIAETMAQTAIPKTVNTIQRSGAKVVLLGDTPHVLGNDPNDCLARHPSSILQCNRPFQTSVTNSPGRAAEMRAAASSGALVVDTSPWFCADSTCPVVIDNHVVYTDDNHITGPFGVYRAPELAAALAPLLKQTA